MMIRPAGFGLAVAAAALLCAGTVRAADMEHTKIAMPVLSLSQAPNLVAEDMGFWKKAGVDVEVKLVRGMGATNAVLAGSVDFSNGSGPTVVRGNVQGKKLMAIMTTMTRPTYEVVLHKDVVKKLGVSPTAPVAERAKALKGLKLALTGFNNVTHVFLKYILAGEGGLSPTDSVKLTTMGSPAMIAALKRHDIDGMDAGAPWSFIPVRQGFGVRWISGLTGDLPELTNFSNTVVITRQGFCDEKPSVCQKVVRGYQMALKYIHEQPEGAKELLRKHFKKMDQSLFEDAFERVVRVATSKEGGKFPPGGLAGAQDFMIKAGHLKKEDALKSLDGLWTNKFVLAGES